MLNASTTGADLSWAESFNWFTVETETDTPESMLTNDGKVTSRVREDSTSYPDIPDTKPTEGEELTDGPWNSWTTTYSVTSSYHPGNGASTWSKWKPW